MAKTPRSINYISLQEYSPVFTGIGTPANVKISYRVLDNILYVEGYFQAGTVEASTFSMSIPSQYIIDPANISALAETYKVGEYQRFNTGSPSHDVRYSLFIDPDTDNTLIYLMGTFNNDTAFDKEDGNLVQTGDAAFVRFSVPILNI